MIDYCVGICNINLMLNLLYTEIEYLVFFLENNKSTVLFINFYNDSFLLNELSIFILSLEKWEEKFGVIKKFINKLN